MLVDQPIASLGNAGQKPIGAKISLTSHAEPPLLGNPIYVNPNRRWLQSNRKVCSEPYLSAYGQKPGGWRLAIL